jgi:hypothetical protein
MIIIIIIMIETDESTVELEKEGKTKESDYKKKIHNLESMLQEQKRRFRIKEQEFERLQKKLLQFTEKEREITQRNKDIMERIQNSDLSFIEDSLNDIRQQYNNNNNNNNLSTNSSFLSPTMKHPNNNNNNNKKKSPLLSNNTTHNHHNTSHTVRLTKEEKLENLTLALKAMEHDRKLLITKNMELELQMQQLIDELNNSSGMSNQSDNNHQQHPNRGTKKGISMTQPNNQQNNEEEDEEDDEEDGAGGRKSRTYGGKSSPSLRLEQQQWEELFHKLQVSYANEKTAETKIQQLRQMIKELRIALENKQLELEARPTVKEWNRIQHDLQEMELKIHELTILKKETMEIQQWKKHLSTSERIKIDKRNHELGLYLLESLPKNIMKDCLQMICRELDLSDISEIQHAITKLKSVVRTVPRMERFIAKVTAYVHDRNQLLNERLAQVSPHHQTQYHHHSSMAGGITPAVNILVPETDSIENAFQVLQR